MHKSCDTLDSSSEDEFGRHSKALPIIGVKDVESRSELEVKDEVDVNEVASDLKSKIRNSFMKTCGESRTSMKSQDLTKRIQHAFKKLSKSRQRSIIESSSSEDENVSSSVNSSSNTVIRSENGEISEDEVLFKESCLAKLCLRFPNYDSMDLQDALVKTNWSVDEAIDVLKSGSIGDNKNGSKLTNQSQNSLKRPVECESFPRLKKKRRMMSTDSSDEGDSDYMKKENIYDSDDSDIDDTLTPGRKMVLDFFENVNFEELSCIPHCSKKKSSAIIQMRPFSSWSDLITKFQCDRVVSTDLIKCARDVLNSRKIISKLMRKCEMIADELEHKVSCLMNMEQTSVNSNARLKGQPSLINSNYKLSPYQLLGLNWLILMHEQNVNGILADEMGLGKTIQAISFLTYCSEQGNTGPFLIIVPSSILDNWLREINVWTPSFQVVVYHGTQEYRRYLRSQLLGADKYNYEILLTTYNLVAGAAEDRAIFKKLRFEYVVFDEAHLLKNMETQRYHHLTKIHAKRRLLLTGTPLQNNLVELMSLLSFLMPNLFEGKTEHLKSMFSLASNKGSIEMQNAYERERVDQAKRIMKPFILRRQKLDVLKELPNKVEDVVFCSLSVQQKKFYEDLVVTFSNEVQKDAESSQKRSGMMMQLRKLANNSLLMRYNYCDSKLQKLAKLISLEPSYKQSNEKYVLEDLQVMSDFELHKLCQMYQRLSSYCLPRNIIMDSGKFEMLDKLLPDMHSKDDRVLLFSQFVIVLDIVEEYMNLKQYKYVRLDGSTPVEERQNLIDTFTNDHSIFVFLLSTRAGGLGINLVAANVVILHDIDFNPYNDKQAVDRCHRIGQTRDVRIIRLVSKDTIEENILKRAQHKLKLEKELIDNNGTSADGEDNLDVASLLKDALGLH